MVTPPPPVKDPVGYAKALAANREAIKNMGYNLLSTTVSPYTQKLPGSNIILASASVSDLQNALSNIGNLGAYDSNREQFQPSSSEISIALEQAKAKQTPTPPPQVNRDLPITDVISTPSIPIIPAPVVETPPVQARGMTPDTIVTSPVTTSTSSPSSLPKIAVIAVAVFGIGLLFLTPKASKRR